jgi:hypothetical protein
MTAPKQDRPCPISARPARVRVARSAALNAGHVREHTDVGRGGRGLAQDDPGAAAAALAPVPSPGPATDLGLLAPSAHKR